MTAALEMSRPFRQAEPNHQKKKRAPRLFCGSVSPFTPFSWQKAKTVGFQYQNLICFMLNWFQSQGQFSDSYFKAKSYLFAKKAQTQHGRRICADRAVFIGGVFLMLVNLPQLNLQSSRRVHTFLYRRAPVSRLLLLEKLSHIINIGKLRISDPALSTA